MREHTLPEHTLFEHQNVRITNQRALFEGKSIPLDSITSVTLARTPARRSVGYALLAAGCLILLGGAWQVREPLMMGGAILTGAGLLLALLPRDRFHLLLGSSSGEGEALTSTQRTLMEGVTRALHNAILQETDVQDSTRRDNTE